MSFDFEIELSSDARLDSLKFSIASRTFFLSSLSMLKS